ncbi:polysaccharide biosynthesis protein [Acetobacter fallax]|uniref:NAD-dependent epimerase/dehydratase family protein n=1 Tax=Acetobacter fallax TaxID=1737473 RepID=A0ABX0K586_9PROT|nr:nucleoside-diphosphate sugar epimerase/dehydratase [Acetobacter fallax]NHO31537.1 NAD-dependent epimerase/dehydratase family protein [Acetobacter fallax]NHO35096.1 NAD-dependent epimerase/dehydratase family protein [Acetobacter fallax]
MVPQRPEVAPRSTRLRPMNRILVNVLLDGSVAAIAAPLARWLAAPRDGLLHPLWFLAGGAITLIVSGVPFRMPQQYWRFSGISDLLGIAGASAASAALFTLGLLATGYPLPSPTFPVIYAVTLVVLLGGLRTAYRLTNGLNRRGVVQRKVVLVGADQVADIFLRAIDRNPASGVRVTGLIGQGTHQAGRRIHNVPILGHVTDIAALLDGMARRNALPENLVITDPNFRGEGLGRVLSAAETHGIQVMRAPVLTTLTPAERVELRPVAIEDLLNRPQVPLDRAGMERLIRDQVVLVTGAGGTIGSELVRQIAGFRPEHLILLDHGEFALWQIDVELGEMAPDVPRSVVVADIRDIERIDGVFALYRPALVFHAAALKHVPIVEQNPCEGLLTNIVGTRVVADAAKRHAARAMVVISTDKAVNPSSLMGASKRAAEMYCQALDIAARSSGRADEMRCVTVRFGNVLGSTGSVVPLFRRQLERGGPLTVTHPEMRRYFMTVPEAVGLVLQASVRGADAAGFVRDRVSGVEPERSAGTDALLRDGGIFVLDMGEPVKIVDLARQMIRLAGLRPDEDVAIRFTGLRPGEKLFEELFHGREAPVPTDAPGLLIATPRVVDQAEVGGVVDRIAVLAHAGNAAGAIAALKALVPEFDHNATGEVRSPSVTDAAQDREKLVS